MPFRKGQLGHSRQQRSDGKTQASRHHVGPRSSGQTGLSRGLGIGSSSGLDMCSHSVHSGFGNRLGHRSGLGIGSHYFHSGLGLRLSHCLGHGLGPALGDNGLSRSSLGDGLGLYSLSGRLDRPDLFLASLGHSRNLILHGSLVLQFSLGHGRSLVLQGSLVLHRNGHGHEGVRPKRKRVLDQQH